MQSRASSVSATTSRGARAFSAIVLLAGYYCLVLEVEGAVVGYGIMSIAAAEAHVLNL